MEPDAPLIDLAVAFGCRESIRITRAAVVGAAHAQDIGGTVSRFLDAADLREAADAG